MEKIYRSALQEHLLSMIRSLSRRRGKVDLATMMADTVNLNGMIYCLGDNGVDVEEAERLLGRIAIDNQQDLGITTTLSVAVEA